MQKDTERHLITCEWCGEDRYVQYLPAKVCSAKCRAERDAAVRARWRAENPERVRERERARSPRDRTAYKASWYARRQALRIAERVRAAAEVVQATPCLALPPVTSQWCTNCERQCERPELPAGDTFCLACVAAWKHDLALRRPVGPFIVGRCQRQGCDETFVVRSGRVHHRFCSPRCALREGRSDGKRRRRARKRAAFVEPVVRRKVFERDGWRCHLCGKKVRRHAKVPHDLAPTIDHIIPQALGGEESMRNVRTAHFICNSKKRDSAMNEQLLLVG